MRAWVRAAVRGEVDASSLVAFRVCFGLASFVAAARFVAHGWVDTLLVAPTHHLHYAAFEFVGEPPRTVLYGLFAVLAASSLSLAAGLFYRASALVYFVVFTYVELIDQALYLNHHYAMTLLAFSMIFLPLGDVGSIDAALLARRSGRAKATRVPRWALATVRLQLALVYFFAGLAKLHPDWWRRAEPLRTWLLARSDTPLVGPLFVHLGVAYAMAWAAVLFDLLVPVFLSSGATRRFAYAALVAFHVATGLLFPIGLFPLLMIAWTLVFFEPDWPRRLVSSIGAGIGRPPPSARLDPPDGSGASRPLTRRVALALAFWFGVQIVVPLRHLAMPGDVLWTYEGFNFSWHVMIVEKGAHADVVVVDRDSGVRRLVRASDYYTPLQTRIMSESPALVVQFAHLAAHDSRRHEHRRVAVYARSFAAMNGRTMQPLVMPDVDLTTIDAWTPASRYVAPLRGD